MKNKLRKDQIFRFRLNTIDRNNLENLASQKGTNISNIVREAIEEYIQKVQTA